MKLKDIYQTAVDLGMKHDPRGQEEVNKLLAKLSREYQDMKEKDQKSFDLDRLANPYADTRILYGDGELEIKKVMAGIDISVGEVLIADRLKEKGQGVDLVVSHHPEGKALASLHDVMHLQEDILYRLGIPINIAEGLMGQRIPEVQRQLMPINHNRTVDAAALFDIPLMCVHTPADNLVTSFLDRLFQERQPETLKDVVDILKEIPEYQEAMKLNAGPKIVVGSEKRRAGKIFVDMTGGTSGSEDAYQKLAEAGVGCIVGMHMGEKHRKEAEKAHINVIIAGHISSDSLGMNLFLDELVKQGVEVLPVAGLIRVQRA